MLWDHVAVNAYGGAAADLAAPAVMDPQPVHAPLLWPRRTTSATLPAKSTPALDPVHRDQVALIFPTYVARPAARAQEDAVRRQDAKIPRVAASIFSTFGMTPTV